MIPSGPQVRKYNFPDIFTSPGVEKILIALQDDLRNPSEVTDIVLNFEKCHWFEVFPLAQLMTILVSYISPKPTLHIIGPSLSILPYFFPYVSRAKAKLKEANLSMEERLSAEG